MSDQLVSCIVPVYNCEQYLEACIRSLLDQDHRDIEIVAVDDGSTDDSPAILRRLAQHESRLLVLRQDNAGGAAARNRALDVARGEFLMIQDADDLAHPRRASLLLNELSRHEGIDFVGSANWLIAADGRLIGMVKPARDAATCAARMPRSMAYCHASIMFRRAVLNGPERLRYNENLRSAHDYELMLRVCRRYRGPNLPQPLYAYRFSGDQLSIREVESGGYRSLFAAWIARSIASGDTAPESTMRNVSRDDVLEIGVTADEIDRVMVGRFRHAFHMMMIAEPAATEALRTQCEAYIRRWRPGKPVVAALRAELAVSQLFAGEPASSVAQLVGALQSSPRATVEAGVGFARFAAHVTKSRLSARRWRPPTL